MAPYSSTIARPLKTKAQQSVIPLKELSVCLDINFYDVNMSSKSKTDSEFSFVSLVKFGKIWKIGSKYLGCVSLKKSKMGFLNPKESENGFCVSLLIFRI